MKEEEEQEASEEKVHVPVLSPRASEIRILD